MRLRKFSVGVVVAMVLIISGCQETFLIKVVDEPFEPTFEIAQPIMFVTQGGFISVSEYDPHRNVSEEVWSVTRVQGASDTSLSRVKYGEPPAGFTAWMAKKDLKPGVIYAVYVKSGGTNAVGYFKILYDGATPKLVNMDPRGELK